jgi:hypothetical protein
MVINSIYHGQHINSEKIAFIKTLIKANPDRSRWFLSRELCRRWNWRYSNGSLKDMTCRGLLLKLESEGLIRLPSKRRIINNPFINRQPPEVVTIDQSPIEWSIKNMPPIELRTVRRTKLGNAPSQLG